MKMLHGRLLHMGATVTDLPVLGCELSQNASGGWAPPGPAEGAVTLLQTPSHYYVEGKGKERVGNTEGEGCKEQDSHASLKVLEST